MKQLLDCDFYKLRKAKYFWVCLLLVIGLSLAGVLMVDHAQHRAAQTADRAVTVTVHDAAQTAAPTGLAYAQRGLADGLTPVLLAIVVALFVGSEFNHGTMKNLASLNHTRGEIYASKLLVGSLAAGFCLLVAFLTNLLAGSLLWGPGPVSAKALGQLLATFGLETLLLIAFVSIFTMFSMLIRQNGGTLAVNICFLQFLTLILQLGQALLQRFFHLRLDLSRYTLDANMAAVADSLTRPVVLRSLAVGIGFLAVTWVIGVTYFKKKDIR